MISYLWLQMTHFQSCRMSERYKQLNRYKCHSKVRKHSMLQMGNNKARKFEDQIINDPRIKNHHKLLLGLHA